MRRDPEEILSYLSELYDDDRDWKSILDPDIADLVLLLNTLPGVITIGSCSGHGISGATGKMHKESDEPYVYLVCKDLSSQYILLSAFRDVNGLQEFQFDHSEIEGPLLDFRFDEYQGVVRFHDNLKHEIKEIEWRKQKCAWRSSTRKPSEGE